MAQIAYYHKYPSKYDWSQIYTYPILNSAFETFILDIREYCDVKYKDGETSANYNDAYDAFIDLGYQASKDGAPSTDKLWRSINSKNPVFIVGRNEARGKGHAWVCEGYHDVSYEGSISMVIDPRYGPTNPNNPYYDYPVKVYPPSSSLMYTGDYFYMNMGKQGENDGWYRANSYNPTDPDYSYTSNQQIIIVKK